MSVLAIVMTAINVQPARAATINAASCSQTDVQTAISAASTGDTVNVPAGTCTWTSLSVSKAITLQGPACTMVTSISITGANPNPVATPSIPSSCPANITLTSLTLQKSTAGVMRIQNFAFTLPGTGNCGSTTPADAVCVREGGTWQTDYPLVIENNIFTSNTGAEFDFFQLGTPGGVIFAHNYFSITNTGGINSDFMDLKGDSGSYPNEKSWSMVDSMGMRDSDSILGLSTTFKGYRNFYLEDNFFQNAPYEALDCDDGCRIVTRHNVFFNATQNTHGRDTSPEGLRHFEIYSNNFRQSSSETNDQSAYSNTNSAVWIRGASGVIYGNTFDNCCGSYWGTGKTTIVLNIRIAGSTACGPYPLPRQIGQGWNGGPITDPIWLWANTWNSGQAGPVRVVSDWFDSANCGSFSTYFQSGRDYVDNGIANTPKAGYTAYTYPHPLTVSSSDTTPPSVPTNLAATAVSSAQINLSWTASTDNVGVTGYTIFRNGTQVGTGATTSYQDTGLSASTLYSYTVSAFDAAGNNSPQSSSASATTQAPTTTPPSITSAASATGTSGSAFSYQITATNSPTAYGATGLPAGISINTGTGLISGMPAAAGTSSATLTASNSGGTGTATLTLTINSTTVFGSPYSTTFPLTENPISEGGRWVGGQTAGGNLWGNVQTSGGMAYGVSEPTQYGDPSAILTGTWGPNQSATAVVKINSTPTGTCCHEAEVRLRMNISAGKITGYEVYCSVMANNPYCHIASWGGPNGSWVNMENSSPSIYLKNGDTLKGTVSGSNPATITMYINGTQVLQVQDTGNYTFSDGKSYGPWTSGNPGIGFYDNQDTNWSNFGFSSFSASDGSTVASNKRRAQVTSQ